MRVAITVQWLIEWGGGIDFSRHIIQGLVETDHSIYVFVPEKELPRKNLVYKALRVLNRNIPHFTKENLGAEKHFSEFGRKITIIHYRRNSLQETINKYEIDVILPFVHSPGKLFNCQWVGYLPDCQHKFLDYMFTQKEIKQRNNQYRKMIATNNKILVNSIDTKKDLLKYYDAESDQIHSLPFCPTVNLEWLKMNEHLLNAYSLPEKYFMISNQFWKHKDHLTAFKALSLMRDPDIHIVCSGKMDDYRDSIYVDNLIGELNTLGLEHRVHFLGFLPKIDQIEILKNSLAVIQPTLFEGGPGGGSVHDAIAVGVPCVLSDININQEVVGPNIFYFKAGQKNDLAETLHKFLTLNIQRPCLASLKEAHTQNLALRADSLNQLITMALK